MTKRETLAVNAWQTVITTAGVVAAALGAQYIAGRSARSAATLEHSRSRATELHQVLSRVLVAADAMEAQTMGAIAATTMIRQDAAIIRELSTSQATAQLLVSPDVRRALDAFVRCVILRSNALTRGTSAAARSEALASVQAEGLTDHAHLDATRDRFIDAARGLIAAQ